MTRAAVVERTVESPRLGTIGITVHESIEAGLARGNGYLWASVTPKGFPRTEEA